MIIRVRFAAVILLIAAVAGVASGQTPPASGNPAQRAVRRQPVTAELERTAFRDPSARLLLERARLARLSQDSALGGYDASTYARFSVGMALRKFGPERLFLRTEHSARVQWTRETGIAIQPTGRRTAFPMGDADLDLTAATPIPFFPGRETLWFPGSGVAQVEVNENELLHPLAVGAEAYYRYATGDSATIRLPDGRAIRLRELRITARRQEWRAFVGSFWFDVDRGSLVRAAYRSAAQMDMWQMANEEQRQVIEEYERRAGTDTGATLDSLRLEAQRARRVQRDNGVASKLFTPARATIQAITVEYGLYQGRFWLPRLNVAEGEMIAGFVRLPIKVEERFRYNSVSVADSTVPRVLASRDSVPVSARADTSDSTYSAYGYASLNIGSRRRRPLSRADEDSIILRDAHIADSLRAAAHAARVRGELGDARDLERESRWRTGRSRQIQRRRAGCATDSSGTYDAGTVTRYDGALRMSVRVPCDTSGFATSPDLPPSIFDEGEAVTGSSERDELTRALGMGLQAGWGPQAPVLHTGLDMLRYNRIEALSVGGSATSELGHGYTARAVARLGVADLVPNGELSLERSNGRDDFRIGAYHRLDVANDDFGDPLSVGASIANLLYARDEGFYYRALGVELAGRRHAPLFGANMAWGLFAERQRSAGRDPKTQASFGNLISNPRFGANIDATRQYVLGTRLDLSRSFGADPTATRLDTRARLEGAFTDVIAGGTGGYGRFVLDMTLSSPVGPFTAAITGAAGTSAGTLPIQRAFFVGGLHTVRGQFARLAPGRVGDAFWLGRAELGLVRSLAFRPSLFYDAGWAGSRSDFSRPGRPMSGAGIGLSAFDGLLRLDVAHGLVPEKPWRVDLSVGARF